MLKVLSLEEAISKAKALAEAKLAKNQNADEFVQLADIDGFKMYVIAGKTVKDSKAKTLHKNSRDVFILALEGEMEFTFEDGKTKTVKAGEYFVLAKNVKHKCVFKKMTMGIEGVYEKGL